MQEIPNIKALLPSLLLVLTSALWFFNSSTIKKCPSREAAEN